MPRSERMEQMAKKGIGIVVLLVLFGMAWPAAAADKFNLSGEWRAWAVSDKDRDRDSGTEDDQSYFNQRFRLGVNFNPNENVMSRLTIDYGEGTWGENDHDWHGWMTADEDTEMELVHAFVKMNSGIFTAKVGQFWNGTANYILWDQIGRGVELDFATPVAIKLNYTKANEGAGENTVGPKGDDTDDDPATVDFDENNKDVDFYGLNVGYSSDSFGINLTAATRQDDSLKDISPWAVGLQLTTKIGPLGINFEVDQFDGSHGDKDVVGTQAYLDLSAAPTKAIKTGIRAVYAAGTDDRTNEIQYHSIQAGAESFQPFGIEGALMYWPYVAAYPFGTNTYAEGSGPAGDYAGVFDPAGASAGSLGVSPYISYTAANNLTVYGKIAYAVPQEDANTNLDSKLAVIVNADYVVFGNTTLSAGYIYSKPEFDDDTPDDARETIVGQLKIVF